MQKRKWQILGRKHSVFTVALLGCYQRVLSFESPATPSISHAVALLTAVWTSLKPIVQSYTPSKVRYRGPGRTYTHTHTWLSVSKSKDAPISYALSLLNLTTIIYVLIGSVGKVTFKMDSPTDYRLHPPTCSL
ncbi:hypothetical protein NL108_012902 [Boleophthalmus pectinirostris]|nr:hypothetical protein NL108_012902 [Boleophthalmus pectinirostris]